MPLKSLAEMLHVNKYPPHHHHTGKVSERTILKIFYTLCEDVECAIMQYGNSIEY